MVGDHKSCQQHFAKMVTIFMPPLQDIACDRSVIVMSGDDIMLGDCEAVSVIGDQEEEVIWRNDEVSCCYCCCYGQGLQVTKLRPRYTPCWPTVFLWSWTKRMTQTPHL